MRPEPMVILMGLLASGDIDLSGVAAPMLSFSAYFINGDNGGDEIATVLISDDGGSSWTTVFNLQGAYDWQNLTIPILEYAGKIIRLGFNYDDGNAWNFGFGVDDVAIYNFPVTFGVKLDNIKPSCTTAISGSETEISGFFTNVGLETITSLDLNWSNGSDTYTETVTGLYLGLFDRYNFIHSIPITIQEGDNTVDFWISNPNGIADPNPTDNGSSVNVTGITPAEGRTVYVEAATGTWCEWCPASAVLLDRLSGCLGDYFAAAAVHNTHPGAPYPDPMEVAIFNEGLIGHPDFTDFPAFLINRDSFLTTLELETALLTAVQESPSVVLSHSVDYSDVSGDLQVEVMLTAQEVIDFAGCRLNVILTEDGVSGTGNDWAQANIYSGGHFGAMGGFESLPDPVPADIMIYDQVGRALLGGYEGIENNLPDVLEESEMHVSAMPAFSVPQDWDVENMHIISLLTDGNSKVINAQKTTFTEAQIVGERSITQDDIRVNIFPNPVENLAKVYLSLPTSSRVRLELINNLGQKVLTNTYDYLSGEVLLDFDVNDFENGLYFLCVEIDGKRVVKPVVILD